MITKILWEGFSLALLLYGSYLVYIFIWFTITRIWNIDPTISKLTAGLVVGLGLVISSYRWFKKKRAEIEEKAT
ncbi:MAG: hypothetical protein GXO45_00170 [Aquificae bacterium]|nr:hypothetical protein [Aquificota bacterium]